MLLALLRNLHQAQPIPRMKGFSSQFGPSLLSHTPQARVTKKATHRRIRKRSRAQGPALEFFLYDSAVYFMWKILSCITSLAGWMCEVSEHGVYKSEYWEMDVGNMYLSFVHLE